MFINLFNEVIIKHSQAICLVEKRFYLDMLRLIKLIEFFFEVLYTLTIFTTLDPFGSEFY